MSQQDFVRAAALMDELYSDLRHAGLHFLLPDVLHLKERALLKQSLTSAEEACETLGRARAEAEALGSRRSLWPILVTLSELERQCGHQTEAEALRKRAGEIVAYIAQHITSLELRTSFLNSTQFYPQIP
ncbi:MAG: hypothetical protein U0401_23610 [Anaerolineae bacterium]